MTSKLAPSQASGRIDNPAARRTPAELADIAARLSARFGASAAERERAGALPFEEIRELKQAGLVNLLIPAEWGGGGGSLAEAANVVLELSKGDASIGMLLAFHYKHQLVPMFLDYDRNGEDILRRSAQENWFWGNITGTWDLTATPLAGGRYRIDGTKKMCTGAGVADVVAISARRSDIARNEQVHFVVAASEERLRNHNDWVDYPGLKLTATDSFTVEGLEVGGEAVIPHDGAHPLDSFPRFYSEFGMPLYAAVLLGSAYGALEGALDYTRQNSGPRAWAGVSDPRADPLTLEQYGRFWISLETARALFDSVNAAVQSAWDRRATLADEELTRLIVRGHALRIAAADASLAVSGHIFDVTGARSLSGRYGLDRHWRDIRMLSTHEPLMYWKRNIGDFILNNNFTRVNFNSQPAEK